MAFPQPPNLYGLPQQQQQSQQQQQQQRTWNNRQLQYDGARGRGRGRGSFQRGRGRPQNMNGPTTIYIPPANNAYMQVSGLPWAPNPPLPPYGTPPAYSHHGLHSQYGQYTQTGFGQSQGYLASLYPTNPYQQNPGYLQNVSVDPTYQPPPPGVPVQSVQMYNNYHPPIPHPRPVFNSHPPNSSSSSKYAGGDDIGNIDPAQLRKIQELSADVQKWREERRILWLVNIAKNPEARAKYSDRIRADEAAKGKKESTRQDSDKSLKRSRDTTNESKENKKKVAVCWNFNRGRCRRGDLCHFLHELKQQPQERTEYKTSTLYHKQSRNEGLAILQAIDHLFAAGVVPPLKEK